MHCTTGKLRGPVSTGPRASQKSLPVPGFRHPPDSWRYHFPWDQLLDLSRKKCQKHKRSPYTSRSTRLWVALSCVQQVPPPSALSRVACPRVTQSPWLRTHWGGGAQSYLGKVLFCLETLLPPALILCDLGEQEVAGEGGANLKLLPSLSPRSTSPSPCPPRALCLAHLPSVLSPHHPSEEPTRLGPQDGSQTGPCRSRVGD